MPLNIDISPDEFVFSTEKKRIALKTLVHVKANAKGAFVVAAIGDAPRDDVNVISIRLFERDAPVDPLFSKFECLESFLKFGLNQMQESFAFLRPIAVVRGIDSLHPFFSGYQVPIVGRAIEAAGAREARFEGPTSSEK